MLFIPQVTEHFVVCLLKFFFFCGNNRAPDKGVFDDISGIMSFIFPEKKKAEK